jgi:hypothetical protein
MSDTNTPNLLLPYIKSDQTEKHVTANEVFQILDAVVQLSVLSRTVATPPDAPQEGQRWIVGPNPSGAWENHVDEVAVYQDGGYQFQVPLEGWLAYVVDEKARVTWQDGGWVTEDLPSGVFDSFSNALIFGGD